MSLILDALRKADAERERGSVPSLHSQPVVPRSVETPMQPKVRPNWLWIAIGVAIGLAGAAAWVMAGRDAPPPSAAASASSGPAQPGSSTAPPAGPAAPVAGAASPPAAAAATHTQPIAEPAPWRQPEERKAPRPDAKDDAPAAQASGASPATSPAAQASSTSPAAAPAAQASSASPAAAPVAQASSASPAAAPAARASSASPAATPVYSREQLPPNIRAELPQFAIGGSIYSSNPASRSLIVNGHLYRERDRLTEELSLDEIKLKAAIFSFRGYRFEILF